LGELDRVVAQLGVQIGVVATPGPQAQAVCDRLVAAGVTGVLNFAPCVLNVPDGVMVRRVDLATELQILAFHEQRRAAGRLASELAQDPSELVANLDSQLGAVTGPRAEATG
jgi:redox-sensing transcriptional repressor